MAEEKEELTLDQRIANFGTSLSDARKDIITAIEKKGVDCDTDDKLSELPEKIEKIKVIDKNKTVIVSAHRKGENDTSSTSKSYTLSEDAYVIVHLCAGNLSVAEYSDGTNTVSCAAWDNVSAAYSLSKNAEFTVRCEGSSDWWACAEATVIYFK